MTRITVIGATGNQGGSVARSLLQNPSFQVRAITRNPSSSASQELSAAGAEVFQANGFKLEEMCAAFADTWGAFVNINSDDKVFTIANGPTEYDMGKTIIDAAAQAGVKHLVFSSAASCTEMTGGKVQMKAMDMKSKIEKYAQQCGHFETVIPIGAGWFFENFLSKEAAPIFGGFPHFSDSEGIRTFRVPYWGGQERVPFLSISDDFGDIVQGIFLEPTRWNGHFVHGISALRSFNQLVEAFQQVTGHKSRLDPILPSWEAFDTHGIHELEDVKLMFGLAQTTGGLYFATPSENDTASVLKKVTGQALGRPADQHELVTAEAWFQAHVDCFA
ncbi:hypothetical protein N7491_011080 [Penicillium cf. griseofulvum]|uniref:NmrA-like domain-containing protein n=1 Tax=Penicillium cf. griseofulvum TaxID=2972120 RepID=A0A9W9N1D4_9EURO|nr:hypothetical protein N7472_001399 [Penicillium cf. griseofulvum]KAJ5422635.1 hypothetical protein N7491_011080 [Penicillium cf. griseofulvum]KAJ5428812.1 hypothetical protein N7445_010266 [Penicillium cf. griseofulvum]